METDARAVNDGRLRWEVQGRGREDRNDNLYKQNTSSVGRDWKAETLRK